MKGWELCLSADVDHRSGWFQKTRLADVMARHVKFRDADNPMLFVMPKKSSTAKLLEGTPDALLRELISRFQKVDNARVYFGVPVADTLLPEVRSGRGDR